VASHVPRVASHVLMAATRLQAQATVASRLQVRAMAASRVPTAGGKDAVSSEGPDFDS
jgi:hypothetical protein